MEPKIRFSEFVDNWKNEILGNVTPVKRGVRVTRKDLNSQGKYPVYQNTDYPMGFYNEYNVKGNSPFVIIGGSAGLIGFSHDNFWAADDCAYFGECEDLDNVFLYNLLLRQGSEIKKNVRGSSVPRLDRKIISDLLISMPSLNEQRQIGNYFLYLDSLIQSTTKKIESLKQVKAASLQSMFPQEGETTPRVRFKGFEGDWEKMLVGKMGTTYSGITGKTKDDFGHGEARFITFLNVLTNARIDTSILEPVNICNGEKQNEVKKGDLLFNTSSETPEEVGMCATMAESIENVYLNSFCFGFRVTEENIDSTFIAYLMRSHIGRKIMSILAQGATRYNLSKNSFCKAEFLIPKTRKEQKAIAEYFTNLDEQITLQTQRLEKLKQIKSACLDNMFV